MKKVVKVVLIALGLGIVIAVIGRMGWIETHTTRYGTVTKVEDDKVVFEDSDGYIWEFLGTGYQEKDLLEVTFWNATTTDVRDDEIENNGVKIIKRGE